MNLPSLIANLSTLARRLANCVRPGHDLVGPETAPQSTESPGTPDTRKSEHSGCGVALQVRGGRAASAQGVAQLWLAPPCSRGRDDARNRGVRPRGSGGQALQVLSRAPGIPGHPTPGVAAPPPDRDATLLCEWRAELMRGTERETLGPSVRP